MRKPRRQVELDDIISNQIIGADSDVIALAMKIHLAVEAILIETIKLFRPDDKIYSLPFPGKTELLKNEAKITADDKLAFDRLNDFRNDFAHIFGHSIDVEDGLALARDLEKYGVDFSDSLGQYTAAQASEYYGGLEGVLEEIGWCILFHAAIILKSAGGRDIFDTSDAPVA